MLAAVQANSNKKQQVAEADVRTARLALDTEASLVLIVSCSVACFYRVYFRRCRITMRLSDKRRPVP